MQTDGNKSDDDSFDWSRLPRYSLFSEHVICLRNGPKEVIECILYIEKNTKTRNNKSKSLTEKSVDCISLSACLLLFRDMNYCT